MDVVSPITQPNTSPQVMKRIGARVLRTIIATFAHVICLCACLMLTLNSRWSAPIFDALVNPIFSGEIQWERLAFGPAPWDLSARHLKLIDALGEEVVSVGSFTVRDYDLAGLTSTTYGAGLIRIERGEVNLKSRPHSEDPHRLIWNIAELFLKPGHLNTLPNGDPKPPVLIHIDDIELEHINTRVEMGVTQVDIRDATVSGGYFELDLARKQMRIRARETRARKADTRVFLRETTFDMTPLERSRAKLNKTLSYEIQDLRSRDFWWIGESFGGAKLNATLYQTDSMELTSWVFDMSRLGVPHARAQVKAKINAINRYLAPWSLDLLRGELKLEGYMHGPLDNPAARDTTIEGQLFQDMLGSARFQMNISKSRRGLVELERGRLWSQFGDLGLKGTLDLKSLLGQVEITAHELIWSRAAPLSGAWRIWESNATGELSLKLRPRIKEVSARGESSDTSSGEAGVQEAQAADSTKSQDPTELEDISALSWVLVVAADLKANGPKLAHLSGRATVTSDELSLHQSELTLESPRQGRRAERQQLNAHGRLDFARRRMRGKARLSGQLKPNSLPPLKLPLSAYIDLRLNVSGALNSPRVSGSIKARKISGGQWGYPLKIKRLKSDFTLKHKNLELKSSVIELPQGRLDFDLAIPLNDPSRSEGWLDLTQVALDLNPLKIPFSSKLDGLICTSSHRGCKRYHKRSAQRQRSDEMRRAGDHGLPRCVTRLNELSSEGGTSHSAQANAPPHRAQRGPIQSGGALCLNVTRPKLSGRSLASLKVRALAHPHWLSADVKSEMLSVEVITQLKRAWDLSFTQTDLKLTLLLEALSALLPNVKPAQVSRASTTEPLAINPRGPVSSSLKASARHLSYPLKELRGRAELDFSLKSQPSGRGVRSSSLSRMLSGRSRPRLDLWGDGQLKLWRVITPIPASLTGGLMSAKSESKLGFHEASFDIRLNPEQVTFKGTLEKLLELGGAYRFRDQELTAQASLKDAQLTAVALPVAPNASDLKAMKHTAHAQLPRQPRSDRAPKASYITPLVLESATGQAIAFTLNPRLACDWINRSLATSHAARLNLGKARFDMSWFLDEDRPSRYMKVSFNQLKLDYWGRDQSGSLIEFTKSRDLGSRDLGSRDLGSRDLGGRDLGSRAVRERGDKISGRYELCDRYLPDAVRPTASFKMPKRNQVTLSGARAISDIYLNPSRLPPLTAPSAPSEERAECAPHKLEESLYLNPMQLEHRGRALSLSLGIKRSHLHGCALGELDLSLFNPLLRAYFQESSGLLKLNLDIDGPLKQLQISGSASLHRAIFSKPRLKLLGELSVKHLPLELKSLREGGFTLHLSPPRQAELKRDDEKLTIENLLISLPRFQLRGLALGVSSPRIAISFPPTLRSSIKLRAMRLEMKFPQLNPSRSSDQESWRAPSISELSRRRRVKNRRVPKGDRDPKGAEETEVQRAPELMISGDILVLSALYRARFLSLNELLSQNALNSFRGKAEVSSLSLSEMSPLLKNLRLDLRFEGNDDIKVETQVANITEFDLDLDLDLTLKGKLFARDDDPIEDRLSLRGEVNAQNDSTLSISKHPFAITQAQVTFGGTGLVSEPGAQVSEFISAELTAQHTFNITPANDQTYRTSLDQQFAQDLITEEVTLTGKLTMDRPSSPFKLNFDFVSQSGRDRFEVIHLILFGRYPEAPTVNNNPQNTSDLLVSQTISFLERPLADTLGLERLTLDPSFAPNNRSLSVNLNKIFSRRLRFSLSAMFAETDVAQSQSFFLEYKLNSLLSGELNLDRRSSEPTSGQARFRLRLSWD